MTDARLEDEATYWRRRFLGPNRTEWLQQLIDPATRERVLPAVMAGALASMSSAIPSVLDLGSGPISCLQWAADHGKITLMAVDPLAGEYAKILDEHGIRIEPPIPCAGEDLAELFRPCIFDLVFARNSLDHCESPRRCAESAAQVLRPGGLLVIESKIDEGTRADWRSPHAWNLRLAQGLLICESRDGAAANLLQGLPLQYRPEFESVGGEWFSAAWGKI